MPSFTMVSDRAKPSNRTKEQQSYSGRGKLHQGLEKKRTPTSIRRSARLNDVSGVGKSFEKSYPSPSSSPTSRFPCEKLAQPRTNALQANDRKRKRQQRSNDELRSTSARKKPRASPTGSKEGTSGVETTRRATNVDPVDYWTKEGSWPKEYFELNDQTREYFNRDSEEESWLKKYWMPEMEHLLARKKSSSSLRHKQLEASSSALSSTTPSDQKPREQKTNPYNHARYETILATKGSFMKKHNEGMREASKDVCRTLLETDQVAPEDSLFRDDLFEDICEEIRNRNEAKIIQDITRLIVPSARHLAISGAKHLNVLIESVNEGWDNSIPVTQPRPQPDYAVGFSRSAFTKEQLHRLQPFVGELTDTSYFMATYYMYLPFFTCEVKCGAAALDIADRQNAHSMTLAVRAVVELFRLVKREKELDREILAFSISHNHRAVRIYGHYPVIDEKDNSYYRHPIRTFDFTELDGKEKWTAYKFTKNVYDKWMPRHFKRICSAINDIPRDVNFELLQSASFSQEPQTQLSQQSVSSVAGLEKDNSQPSPVVSQGVTPNTSFTQKPSKRPRNKRAAE